MPWRHNLLIYKLKNPACMLIFELYLYDSDNLINPLSLVKVHAKVSGSGTYQCQSGFQWTQWAGPIEMNLGSLLNLAGCIDPTLCCCHSSYCTICNGEQTRYKQTSIYATSCVYCFCVCISVCLCMSQLFRNISPARAMSRGG